jgi:hypothetical protein
VTITDTLLNRRHVEMRHAAVAYAITRISDFTNAGVDLTPNERAALKGLIDATGGRDD